MTVLTIRAHKRYAVRRLIWLRRPRDGFQVSGLMIELSRQGCRISNLGSADFASGDQIVVESDRLNLTGQIRWTRRGIAGVRLNKALSPKELSSHLTHLRERDATVRCGT